MIIMLLVSGGLLLWHIAQNYAYTANTRPFTGLLSSRTDQALVFLLPRGPFIWPLLLICKTPLLMTAQLSTPLSDYKNFTLLDAYPERIPYRFDYYGPIPKHLR